MNELKFLNYGTQGSWNRITDRETTIRVLLAIYFQANLADTIDCDGKQDWQTPKMIGVCNIIQDALRLLDAEDVLEDMIENGDFPFSNNGQE